MKKLILTISVASLMLFGCKKDNPEPQPVDNCPYISVLNSERIYKTVDGKTTYTVRWYMYLIKDGDTNYFQNVTITEQQWMSYKTGQQMCDYK